MLIAMLKAIAGSGGKRGGVYTGGVYQRSFEAPDAGNFQLNSNGDTTPA